MKTPKTKYHIIQKRAGDKFGLQTRLLTSHYDMRDAKRQLFDNAFNENESIEIGGKIIHADSKRVIYQRSWHDYSYDIYTYAIVSTRELKNIMPGVEL